MKVDIEELRMKLNNPPLGYANMAYELNEALNELESRRLASNEQVALREENLLLTQTLARLRGRYEQGVTERNELREQVEFYQEERANCECDPLNNLHGETPFAVWFAKLHPETIESITFNLRKKEH